MLRHARLLLPASFSFTSDDESVLLGLWIPPYRVRQPDTAAARQLQHRGDLGTWDCMEARVGAAIYDRIIELGWARKRVWESPELDVERVGDQLHEEVSLRREGWELAYNTTCGDPERQFRDLYLGWGARIVVMLAEEWDLRKTGVESYIRAAAEGRLPWQQMIKDMTRLLGQSA